MRSFFFSLVLAALALCLVQPPAAFAQETRPDAAKDATAKDAAAVKKLLEAKFPGAAVSNVAKSPYFGLYEAQFDERMVYTDAKVTYVVVGAIYDANSKQNLTDARLRQLNRVAWSSLPLDLAFKLFNRGLSAQLIINSWSGKWACPSRLVTTR